MKRLVLVLAATAFGGYAYAEADMKDHDMQSMHKQAPVPAHKASGVVTNLDKAKKKVSIQHGAVPTIGWPAMTMTFSVKDPALLAKLAKDKKVDFEFVQQGKDYVITSVN